MVNKRIRNAVLGCNLKNDRMISVQGKPFNITVIQVYALISNAEEAEQLYEDLQDLLELTKEIPEHHALDISFTHQILLEILLSGCQSNFIQPQALPAILLFPSSTISGDLGCKFSMKLKKTPLSKRISKEPMWREKNQGALEKGAF